MRTVTFKSVLVALAQRCGLGPDPDDFTTIDADKLTSFIQDRYVEGFEWAFWPELTRLEQRQYRPSWLVGTAYVVGNEVFNEADELYYTSILNGTGQQPDLSPTYWELTEDMDRYIAYEQTGETAIGTVKNLSSKNPRTNQKYPGNLGFELSNNGVQVSALAPVKSWIEYRIRPTAQFTSVAYDGATAYVVGDVVFDVATSGECYVCIQDGTGQDPSTSPTYWTVQEFPYILKKFVVYAGYADYIRSDGQQRTAETEENTAYGKLSETVDVEFGQQRQPQSVEARVY